MAGNPGGGGWGNNPYGPPGGAPPGGFGPPGGGAPGGFGGPPGGFGAPPGAPPGGFGAPPGGGYGAPPGGFPGAPGGFQQPPMGYGAPGGFNAMPPPQKSSGKGMLVGVIVAVFALVCVGGGVAAYMAYQKEQQTYGPLKEACNGHGVPGARMYNPATPPHRLASIGRSHAGGDWTVSQSLVPSSRRADNVAGTDIVMCWEPEVEVPIETCEVWNTRNGIRVAGSTRMVPRVMVQRPVRLVSAQTGVTLNQTVLTGTAPPLCSTSFGHRGTASDFRGPSPDSDEAEPYLAPLLDH